ncbi:S-adenosyl-L-methionine-dependentmethyltransferases superfamily protein [Striga asiatica]|uniref:S-adenosyl-L-methionine-dependentmethyltransferases superfamily protein n=1 Tax=Striga asiatica TaxID=4170 RepID=A0A5A7PNJ2_STRAF|nr:S-adenosyl-L-methionine-dependentmethyltransferases superfamily protein [Striga asiatica]
MPPEAHRSRPRSADRHRNCNESADHVAVVVRRCRDPSVKSGKAHGEGAPSSPPPTTPPYSACRRPPPTAIADDHLVGIDLAFSRHHTRLVGVDGGGFELCRRVAAVAEGHGGRLVRAQGCRLRQTVGR